MTDHGTLSLLMRHKLMVLWEAAVARAQPSQILPSCLPPPPAGRTVVIGAGKASAAMARALQAAWPPECDLSGVVITRYGHVPPAMPGQAPDRIRLLQAAHPVSDQAGQQAVQTLLSALQGLTPDDLVVALMSGGGSALLPALLPGWTLDNEQALHQQLLACGATIGEMNTVRRHLSALKGGRLAQYCRPARLCTLAISDVPGDHLTDIASGPTVPDPTTCADACRIIERYPIQVPPAWLARLRRGELETPKPSDPAFAQDQAILVASAQDMLQAAADQARQWGWSVQVLSDRLQGQARDVGRDLAHLAMQHAAQLRPHDAPRLLLSGGETTVVLGAETSAAAAHAGEPARPKPGGRNRECLLSAAVALQGHPQIWMLAADTDGIDGSDDAAGAIVTPQTWPRAQALGLDAAAMLDQHESGRFFAALQDQVVSGPTYTNVNDFRAVLIWPPAA